MRPLFTVHAGELLVGQHIEQHFKRKNVWVPTKDLGVDLLVTNSKNTKLVTLQVKFSRDFLPIMKLEIPIIRKLRSCTWFTVDRNKLAHSSADRWVFVLWGVERGTDDYVVIKPRELLAKLKKLHPMTQRYQVYIWVTQDAPRRRRAWLTRDLTKPDQQRIADGSFRHSVRDLTSYLNDWRAIKSL
jgi:hypothetical protein